MQSILRFSGGCRSGANLQSVGSKFSDISISSSPPKGRLSKTFTWGHGEKSLMKMSLFGIDLKREIFQGCAFLRKIKYFMAGKLQSNPISFLQQSVSQED